MYINNQNPLPKKEISIQDLFNYIFGTNVFTTEKVQEKATQDDESNKTKETKEEEYIPQIGDVVVVTDGQFKGISGEIIAEVIVYDSYQIKVSDINAIYVPRDKVRVVDTKANKDRQKQHKIDKLNEEIKTIKSKMKFIEEQLDRLDEVLDDKYKELEKLEG